jgi:RNA methyltransferase, TrmH family
MITNNEIKHIRSLSQKKHRQIAGEFIAEGLKSINDILSCGMSVRKIYTTDLSAFVQEEDNVIEKISEKQLAQISNLKTPHKALAIVKIQNNSFDITFAEKEWVLALDNINDPGNLGTIIRTADWFGIKHILCSTDTVDIYNPKVVQSTMGSIARVQVHYLDLKETLANTNAPVFGTYMDGENMRNINLGNNGILVVGSEANGISRELEKVITKKISIARINEGAESLNAAIATAILCYQIRN